MPYISKPIRSPTIKIPASSLLAAYRAAQAMLGSQPETQENQKKQVINSSFLRPQPTAKVNTPLIN